MPHVTEQELDLQDKLLGVCPKCGTKLVRVWGCGWDWDMAICPERGCDYSRELDTMTSIEPDNTIYQTIKEED